VLFFTAPSFAAEIDGLKITEMKVGSGDLATRHAKVSVHYTGWTMDGKKFDSSVDRGTPFDFTLAGMEVIPGWDFGVEGMRVGGKRELIIAPELAYGSEGAGGVIPPNATLKFEVELLGVVPPKYSNINSSELTKLIARGVTVVDLRRADEWAQTGVIEGAKLITAFDESNRIQADFLSMFQSVAGQNDEVIVICRSGNRSSLIANALANNKNYSKIYNVQGGISQWIKDGGAVVAR
jgi:rhodanese-related sulfurtransferase